MFMDLGLSGDHERALVAASVRMGYDVVARCHRVTGALRDSDRCRIAAVDSDALAMELPGMTHMLRINSRLSWDQTDGSRDARSGVIQQLTRLTVVAEDQTQVQALAEAQAVTATYDLVAVQPLSEQALRHACNSTHVDIISLNMGQRLPFKLRPQVLKPALARGAVFEISYSQALREASVRMNVFNNAQSLCRATNGRGIILTSNTSSTFELRGPYDVINLATLMGLDQQASKEAITKNCEAVLESARRRRRYKGCIQVLPRQEEQDGEAMRVDE